ncbi:ff domain protein [Cystoisospora suis]|uniref:Ff domain protein n=1 Tax=Cystoisospora suis TaxID=483139 RepID=A0A2C6KIB9_9APIC|nr:ff domain protein [Cystoisospora suis]
MQPFTPPPPPAPPSGAGGRESSLIFHRADNRPHWMKAASHGHTNPPMPALPPALSSPLRSFPCVPSLHSTPSQQPLPQCPPYPPVSAFGSNREVSVVEATSNVSSSDCRCPAFLGGSGAVPGSVQCIAPSASPPSCWRPASQPSFLPLSELNGSANFQNFAVPGHASSASEFAHVTTSGIGTETVDNIHVQPNSLGRVALNRGTLDTRSVQDPAAGSADLGVGFAEPRGSVRSFAPSPAAPSATSLVSPTGVPGEFSGVVAPSFAAVNDSWARRPPDSLFRPPFEKANGTDVPVPVGSGVAENAVTVGRSDASQHYSGGHHAGPQGAFRGSSPPAGGVSSEHSLSQLDGEGAKRICEKAAEDPTVRNVQELLEQQQTMIRQLMLHVQQQQSTPVKKPGEAAKRDIGKPESYEVIGSSSWCRVETTTGVKYFYNRETKQATWSCPSEIEDIVRQIDMHMGGTRGSATVPSPLPRERPSPSADPGKRERRPREDEEDEELDECASSSESSDEESEEAKQLKRQIARYEAFKQLLREKSLSPFAQYEKTLPKLLFDPRFAAIPPDQRKRLFEKCLKEITAESRRGQKEHIDAFRELMNELYGAGHIHASSTVETLEKRCGHDARWLGGTVPFVDWEPIRRRLVQETVERRKQEKDQKKNNIRRDFKKLMRDKMAERPREEWTALRKELRTHPQYLQLGSASERERIFQQVCEELTILNEEKKRLATAALEDADTKRMRLVKTEAAAAFMNMLVERVKNPFAHGDSGAEMPLAISL